MPMSRDPVLIPKVPGVFALVNRKRRFVYLAFTTSLQKRSHAMAHMLEEGEAGWSVRDMPIHPADEFLFMVLRENVEPEDAEKWLKRLEAPFVEKGYRVIGGRRSAVPMVEWRGKRMLLSEAVDKANADRGLRGTRALRYSTAWRRLNRGWTINAVLGYEPAPPRWGRRRVSRETAGVSNDTAA